MKPTRIYFLIGAKWFDKVNGNTYYNTKIIVVENNQVVSRTYSGFTYGYGSCYYSEVACELKKQEGENYNQVFVDGGSFYLLKREVKNGWF